MGKPEGLQPPCWDRLNASIRGRQEASVESSTEHVTLSAPDPGFQKRQKGESNSHSQTSMGPGVPGAGNRSWGSEEMVAGPPEAPNPHSHAFVVPLNFTYKTQFQR